MLDPNHHLSAELIGRYILYKWPNRLGGWMKGEVKGTNTDADATIGGKQCNFEVYYAEDNETAIHLLTVQSYGLNSKAKVDSWVLLE